jgi:hypothetical protein
MIFPSAGRAAPRPLHPLDDAPAGNIREDERAVISTAVGPSVVAVVEEYMNSLVVPARKGLNPLVAGASAVCLLTLAGCGLGDNSSNDRPGAPPALSEPTAVAPWEEPVRKAICGPLDRPETGLHGQVPAADRASGRSQQGYNCNLELVGQWQGDGASWQHAWYEDCAYYDTRGDTTRENYGTVVIDASQRSNPHPTAYLQTTPMIDPWESLKVHEQRGLLAAVDGLGGGGGPDFDVYDVAGDCLHPKLLFSGPMGDTSGHEGNWAQTGKTYWSSSTSDYSAFDVSDPTKPVYLLTWTPPTGTHGLTTNADGTRGYFTGLGLAVAATGGKNGLIIADTSEIESRKPAGEVKIISEFYWTDGSETSQHTIPIKIGGHPYLVYVDEAGVSGKNCGSGLHPFAFARIIDIADEANPKLVAKLMLETHDAQNCALVMGDYAGQVLFGYDSHYCGVDDPEEATALACGYFNSGVRVFDIRRPYFPREIAYFNPPAQVGKHEELQGSQHANGPIGGAEGANMTADWCSANVRFVKERGELWTTCQDNGFMILKFTNGVWPFNDGPT